MIPKISSIRRQAIAGSLLTLCKVIQSLRYARHAHLDLGCTSEDVAALDAPILSTETALSDLLDTYPHLLESNQVPILSTLHPALIERLPEAEVGTHDLTDGDWRLALTLCSVEDLELMISRGLGVGRRLPAVFHCLTKQVRPPARAMALAKVIGERIGSIEQARGADRTIVWFHNDVRMIRTSLFAPYLRAQVKTYPFDLIDVIGHAQREQDVATLMRFHLAGAPDDLFFNNPTQPGPAAKFSDMLKSNHGRIALLEISGGLEAFLDNPDRIRSSMFS